jgi:ribosomal protein L20A (L18A)
MPKLRGEGPEGKLTLLQYLATIEDWINEHGAPHDKQGAWINLDDSIRSFWSKLGGNPTRNLAGRVGFWHSTYGTPMNVATGQFHHAPKPGGLGLDWYPPKDELLQAWAEWLLDWTRRETSRQIWEDVKAHQYNSFGEEHKTQLIDRIFERAAPEPMAREWRKPGARGRQTPASTPHSHIGTGCYPFIAEFLALAQRTVDVVSYSVSTKAVRALFKDVTPGRLDTVRFFAQRFHATGDEIQRYLKNEKGVRIVEVNQPDRPLHAKLIVRDSGADGAILVGSANITLSSTNRFEVCVTSTNEATVRDAREFVRCLSTANPPNQPPSFLIHNGVGFIHSFPAGGLPVQLVECSKRALRVAVFNPFFVDRFAFALVGQARRNRRGTDGRALLTTIELSLGWPDPAGRDSKRMQDSLLRLVERDKESILAVYGLDDRFHGKVYLFEFLDGKRAVIVSSANLTKRSLVDTIECGLYTEDPEVVQSIWDRLTKDRRPVHETVEKPPGENGHAPPPVPGAVVTVVSPAFGIEGPRWESLLRELIAECGETLDTETHIESQEAGLATGDGAGLDPDPEVWDVEREGSEVEGATGAVGESSHWLVIGSFWARRGYWQHFRKKRTARSPMEAREWALSEIGGCHGVKRNRIRIEDIVPDVESA